jgi:2-oxoglutarate dehydrogenase E1 component
MKVPETLNAEYIDTQYQRWKADAGQVTRDWQFFFEGFELARTSATGLGGDPEAGMKQVRVQRLIRRYRELGHLLSCTDPLAACPTDHPLLALDAFGLELSDLDQPFSAAPFSKESLLSLKEIVRGLKETYCHSIGVEYMHIQDPEERSWLQERMETSRNRAVLASGEKQRLLEKLVETAFFENFLNKKYIAQTRFSLEGADAVVAMLDALVRHLAAAGCREIILGMAHRGRLNVQCHVLGKPYEQIFGEFESCYDPENLVGAGDVKYHNGYLADVPVGDSQRMRMFLVNNPSHLESVDPVVQGLARCRQEMIGAEGTRAVFALLLHGDAAFAGQGVVAETLNLSQLEGYRTGGTLHVVINNQIGYTTLPEDARSTRYSTDVAKMLMVPIFHVHGEDPEALVHVVKLAADYRMAFGKDVVIDVICYRRYGHNEGDEPYFTQPQMYERIRQRPPLHRIYGKRLLEEKVLDEAALAAMEKAVETRLASAYDDIHGSACAFPEASYYEQWAGVSGRYSPEPVDTGVKKAVLLKLAQQLARVPDGFSVHSKLQALLGKRLESVKKGEAIDWANAEALAFASLLVEGIPVRLSGQDSRRGTFSQRHAALVDTASGKRHEPLNTLKAGQAPFFVYDSLLAEYAVLGFEYGYSLARPDALVIWEAQFGDFANTAQVMIDLYITSGEAKWQRLSGLVMLLPHGMDGLGPEHSSARPERFLQMCATDNIQVCNPSTPAQYFHMLRRQVIQPFRKPLVVMAPKSLLRHPMAVSDLSEMSTGHFQPILYRSEGSKAPKRILFCSGKIYYELENRRNQLKRTDTLLVRMEQLYPFPEKDLAVLADEFKRVKDWGWVQEEAENMGAWRFVRPRLEALVKKAVPYIGRPEAASPATGFPKIYRRQQAAIVDEAMGAAPNGGSSSS